MNAKAGKGASTHTLVPFVRRLPSHLLAMKGSMMNLKSSVRFFLCVMAALALAFPAIAHADSGGTNAGQAFNMTVVGHHDLGGRGFNADVWVHKGYAYVGQWGFGDWASGSKDRFCPQGSNTSVLVNTMLSPNYIDIGAGVAIGSDGAVYYVIDTARPTSSGLPQPDAASVLTVTADSSQLLSQYIIPVSLSTARPDGTVYHKVQYGQSR